VDAFTRLLLAILQHELYNVDVFVCPEHCVQLLFRWGSQKALRSLTGVEDAERCKNKEVSPDLGISKVYSQSTTSAKGIVLQRLG